MKHSIVVNPATYSCRHPSDALHSPRNDPSRL
jgi:hypothetical protein